MKKLMSLYIKKYSVVFNILILVLSVITSTIILLQIAYHNGYPLFMGDSNGYVLRGFSRGINYHWELFYSFFIRISSFNDSIWWVIVLQNIIISYLTFRIFQIVFKKPIKVFFYTTVTIITLNYASTLPYMTNLVMSDVFITYGIFSILILYLTPKINWEAPFLVLLLSCSINAHNSHPVILGGIFISILLISLLFHFIKKPLIDQTLLKGALVAYSFIFAAFLLKPAINSYFIYQPDGITIIKSNDLKGSNSKYHFIWMKFRSKKKIYQRFLNKYCPEKDYSYLCNKEKMNKLSSDEEGLLDDFHGTNQEFFQDIEDAGKTLITDFEFIPYLFSDKLNRLYYIMSNMLFKNIAYGDRLLEIVNEHVPNDDQLVHNSLAFKNQLFSNMEIKQKRRTNQTGVYIGTIITLLFLIATFFISKLRKNHIHLILLTLVGSYLINCLLFAIAGNIYNARYSARVSWLLVFGGMISLFYVIDIIINKIYIVNSKDSSL